MKQFITSLALTLFAASSIFGQSMLKVSLKDRYPITVSVDGRYFNKRGETVTVSDLPQGRHYVKIYTAQEDRRGRMTERTIFEGKVKTYRGQLTHFLYDANAHIYEITEEDLDYNAMNNRPPSERNSGEGFNNRNLNNYDTRDNGAQAELEQNNSVQPPQAAEPVVPAPSVSAVSASTDLDAIEKAEAEKLAKAAKAAKAAKPVTDPKLEKARKKIVVKKTDTDKLEMAREVFANEKLTTAKVLTIISWFDFENSRVDFAKWAYPNVTDQKNYKKVVAGLTMKNYRDDLNKFIKTNK